MEEAGFRIEVGDKSETEDVEADDGDERRKRQLASCEAQKGCE